MLEFDGPIRPSFFLTFDAPLRAVLYGVDGAARLRVMRETGYPHDLRVTHDQPAVLHAGRVFAPVVDEGARLGLEVDPAAGLRFLVLCANCFTEIWSEGLGADDRAGIDAAHAAFWGSDVLSARGCPNCHAAAAKPH